jgi:hypothetical protein
MKLKVTWLKEIRILGAEGAAQVAECLPSVGSIPSTAKTKLSKIP